MIRSTQSPARRTVAAAFLLLGTGACLQAQSTVAPATADVAKAQDDDVVILSPFTVTAENDQRYRATDTLAGTRIRTELKDVGSAVSVVTADFLRDTGATSNQSLLQYTTGTEVGGVAGNFAGVGNGQNLDDTGVRLNPNGNTRVRGLAEADNTRDFFLSDIPWDSFNVGRIDLQRGPNAMLFGVGSPAGIINSSTNAAGFTDKNQIEFRYGSYGSMRKSLDFNKVLLDDELALRISALDDHTKYRQDPAYNRDRRIYGALRYDPKFLHFEGARTTIKVNYEAGKIDANRPRALPPGDLITPWWTDPKLKGVKLNAQTIGLGNPAAVNAAHAAGDYGTGARSPTLDGGLPNPNYYPAIGAFSRNYGGIVAVFADPDNGGHTLIRTDIGTRGGIKSDGTFDEGIGGIPWTIMSGLVPYKDFAGTIGLPDAGYGLYKNYCLQDETVFDFYNQLLDGPNKGEWSRHEAFNASLAQTFFNNRVGFEAVYDRQNYRRGQWNMMSEFGQSVTIDMNEIMPDGTQNANFGRACVVSDAWANNAYWSTRDAYRVTAFGELRFSDFMEKSSWLTKLLGRHVVTGLMSGDTHDTESLSWIRSAADATYGAATRDPNVNNRTINTITYFGPSLRGRDTISGANLPRLTAVQTPKAGALHWFDSTWKGTVSPGAVWTDQYGNASTQSENPANYIGWVDRPLDVVSADAGDRESLLTSASLSRMKLNSKALSWQAYFWDGTLVGTAGVRKDTAKSFALSQAPDNKDGSKMRDRSSADYRLPDVPSVVKGTSKSYSVVLHTPKELRRHLPWNTDISLFYNKSANFQPAAGRVDAVGNVLAPPQGKTKDYGFMISTLDDKISLKINWYKTTVTNAPLSNFSGDYMLPAVESWGYMFAKRNLERSGSYGTSNSGAGGYAPVDASQSVADAQAIGDAICNAWMANIPSDSWYTLWNIDRSQWNSWMGWSTPAGFTITGDTMSKGVEYELNVSPTNNLNISINAAKTNAMRTNMAQSMVAWIESRNAVYNTPVMLNGVQVGYVGDVRFWDAGNNPNETARGKFTREFMSGYTLYRMQENSNVPELRPWRFNLVANYSFDEGFLKGVNVGLGYRWQDKVVVGYKLTDAINPATGMKDYDLANPYMGKAETNIDMWIGYGRKLTSKVDWRIQLNLRNITTKKELIPVTVQPDGSMAVGRISDPLSWTLANTFTF